MLSSAASPADWATTDLPRLFRNDLHAPEPGPRSQTTLGELLADDHAELRHLHQRLVADGATPQAAAHYLVGWYPGLVAAAVGYALATTRAGVVLREEDLTFDVVAGGWPEACRPRRISAVVVAGHPWAGQPVVAILPGDGGVAAATANVAAATCSALIELLRPFVTACHQLARTRVSSLWNEVADGFGHAVAHQRHLVVTQEMLDDLDMVLTQPSAPWNRRPRLGWASSPSLGPVHVAQKGGCCLAFTERPPDDTASPTPAADRPAVDDHLATESDPPTGTDIFTAHAEAYRKQFPDDPYLKRYCSTCRFRTARDVDDRQLFWAELRPSL